MEKRALVLGGAGFIGSHISRAFLDSGYEVTIVDGLVEGTGGRLQNIESIQNRVAFIGRRIEEVDNLFALMSENSIIIDSIAWTSHLLGMRHPLKDMEINLAAHLRIIECIPKGCKARIIYLASRSQYGSPKVDVIDESTPMIPNDVQGIHKVAAESHYRIFSKLKELSVTSLRLPNCFGENQLTIGNDIGLVGGFIRDLLAGKEIIVYGHQRRRNLVYVRDLAGIVVKISTLQLAGFEPVNIAGMRVTIKEVVQAIVDIAGSGSFTLGATMPEEIRKIDIGEAEFSESRLRSELGEFAYTDIKKAISSTVSYFKRGAE